MDLNAYGRVLRRHWYIVGLGVLLALALATLSYYRVDWNGGRPTLTPRKAEQWQSSASLFLTEKGFPAGRRQLPLVAKRVGGEIITVPKFNNPGSFASLAGLYARLAGGDEVRARVVREGGPLDGSYQVKAGTDGAAGRAEVLPIVTFFGFASTPAVARANAGRALRAFVGFIKANQAAARIPENNRVVLQVLNQPQPPLLVEGRKKTLPIAVFLAVLFAAIALAFVLENTRAESAQAERQQPGEPPVAELDRERPPQRREDDGERQPSAPAALGTRRWARGSTR